jgi:hypothetical protein
LVSEDIELQGATTSYGVPSWGPHCPQAAASAPSVARILAAGAACLGKTAIQSPDEASVGENVGGPTNRARVAGGGATGTAAAVATGLATFGLAVDVLGQARTPAACCGVFAYRPTPGVLGGPASSTSSSSGSSGAGAGAAATQVQAVSVIAREPGVLLKVAEALGAPGGRAGLLA